MSLASASAYIPTNTPAVSHWKTPLVVIGALLCLVLAGCGVTYVVFYKRLRESGKLYYPTQSTRVDIVDAEVEDPDTNDAMAPGVKNEAVISAHAQSDATEAEVHYDGERHRKKRHRQHTKDEAIREEPEEEEEEDSTKNKTDEYASPSHQPLLSPDSSHPAETTPHLARDTYLGRELQPITKQGSVETLTLKDTKLRGAASPGSLSPKSVRSISKSLKSLSSSVKSLKESKLSLKPFSVRSNPDGKSPDLSPTSLHASNDITPLMSRRKRGSRTNLSRASSRTGSELGGDDGFEFDDTVFYEPGSYFQSDDIFLDPCEYEWQSGTMKKTDGQQRDVFDMDF